MPSLPAPSEAAPAAAPKPLPVSRINHVTLVVKDLPTSVRFYEKVLGFYEIRRPGSLEVFGGGAWLWHSASMSIHLLEGCPLPRDPKIDLCADHMSFQPTSGNIADVEAALRDHGIKYVKNRVKENDVEVEQIFFHDPDDHMLEVCPCDGLPVCPVAQFGVSDASDASGHSRAPY
jgi:catechol 2,3-dioxygenase-like lactoylglutathione lyase family enzyme